jgi:uncharacterized protein YraI
MSTFTDASAVFYMFGCPFDGGRKVALPDGTESRDYTNNEGRPSMRFRLAVLAIVVGLAFSALPASAAITHTTTNLNLRAGPGTHHRVKAIIPAGAPIDIESCGDTWCYMAWAGHVGYVKQQYLMHHVTVEVPPLVHVTHVHKHGLINF